MPALSTATIWTRADSVEKVDDYTVKITTPEPDALFLRHDGRHLGHDPARATMRRSVRRALTSTPSAPDRSCSSSGSRATTSPWRPTPTTGERACPRSQNLIFRPIPESSTRVAAIQTGEVDIVQRLTSEEAQSLLGAPNVKVITYPVARIYYIAFNNLTTGVGQPTEDPLVRQAMNYAVDVDAIIDALFDGFAQPATGYVASGEMGYGVVEPFGYDPDKAKELLAEAGYPDGFEMGLACPAGAYAFFEQVCEAVQGYLGDVGIETEPGDHGVGPVLGPGGGQGTAAALWR